MSTAQVLVLGALAGCHDLPRPATWPGPEREHPAESVPERDGNGDPALPARRGRGARRRAGRGGAGRRGERGRLVVAFLLAGLDPRGRRHRRADEPRLLRRTGSGSSAARRCSAREPRRPRSSKLPWTVGLSARALARAADRDRDRPAQLLGRAGDRPVGRAGRGLARAAPRHRLRAAQRDRGLRHRRSDLRLRVAAVLALPRAARADRRRADVPRHAASGRRTSARPWRSGSSRWRPARSCTS